jgi:hypothetical protein
MLAPVVSFCMGPPPELLPPVVRPSIEPPVVVLLAAGPPDVELPPAEPPELWASANVLESAKAAASAIVLIFMVVSSWFIGKIKSPQMFYVPGRLSMAAQLAAF